MPLIECFSLSVLTVEFFAGTYVLIPPHSIRQDNTFNNLRLKAKPRRHALDVNQTPYKSLHNNVGNGSLPVIVNFTNLPSHMILLQGFFYGVQFLLGFLRNCYSTYVLKLSLPKDSFTNCWCLRDCGY